MSTNTERRIRDVRDVWGYNNVDENKENPHLIIEPDSRSKHKYKTLERHLSMKKTIRKKMMRDLREIGDAGNDTSQANSQSLGFLEQIRNDHQPPANIDKPSLWKRLTRGWTNS
jgi:hypothetical protein